MSGRVRTTLFWIFVVVCVGGAIGYIRWRITATDRAAGVTMPLYDPTEPDVAAMLDDIRTGPHLFFQSSRAYGRIGVVKATNPGEQWILNTLECERSHFGKSGGLCLVLNRESMQPRAYAYFLDARFQPLGRLELAGLPIRARISPDGRLGA